MKILTLLTLIFLTIFANIEISKKQESELGIKTMKPKKATSIEFGAYNAKVTLDAKDIISVGLSVDAVILDIFVKSLESVKKGEKLLSIRSSELLNLQKEYIDALIESDNTQNSYKRDERLFSEGIISQKNLLISQKESLNSQLRVKLYESELLMSGFNEVLLRRVRDTHTLAQSINILAQSDGLVDAIAVNVGQKVESNKTMMKIYADAKRYLELNVPIAVAKNIALGDRCYFESKSAKIVAISNIANEETQSVKIRAVIEDAKGVMINRVYFTKIKKSVENAFEIEKSALVYEQNKPIIFRKTQKGYEALSVLILKEDAQIYTIQADLNEDDEVAISSTSALLSALEHQNE